MPSKLEQVKATIDSFNKGVKDANNNADLTFASLVNATADGFNVALERTIPAFREGRTMDGTAGVLEMIGSLTPMLGAIGGPAGGAAGGLLSMALGIVSAILRAFQPQSKSLTAEIKEELQHLHAQLVHDELIAALGDVERASGPMHMVTPGSRTWEQMQSGWINMFEGNAAHQLNLTRSWLEKPENRSNKEWELIFEAYWHVTTLRLQVFAQTVTKLKNDGEADKIGHVALDERKDRDREFARQLRSTAVNKGSMLHVGTGRGLWERKELVSEDEYTQLRTGVDEAAIGPVSRQMFALDRESGKVWQRFNPDKNEWKEFFAVSGGARRMVILPEPSPDANGRAAERLIVLNKAGDRLCSKLTSGSTKYKVGDTQLPVKPIREFLAAQVFVKVPDPTGAPKLVPETFYFALGDGGQVLVGRASVGAENPIGEELRMGALVQFNENLRGLAVGRDGNSNEDQLIAYSESGLRVRKFVAQAPFDRMNPGGLPVDEASKWQPLELPQDVKGQRITGAAGSITGQVLVMFERKLWVYRPSTRRDDGTWNWEWKGNSRGESDFVFADAIPGFVLYSEYI